jgi:hypothetical protein
MKGKVEIDDVVERVIEVKKERGLCTQDVPKVDPNPEDKIDER